MGAGFAGLGLLSHLFSEENSPQTPEEYCDQVSSMVDTLCFEYGAKIAAFEHAYKITGQDIVTKNEQLEIARQQWHTQIDEEALSLFGNISTGSHENIVRYIKWLSTTKVALNKKRRETMQENNNPLLCERIEEVQQKVSLIFLQLSFLNDCIECNRVYLDLLDTVKRVSVDYTYVIDAVIQKKDLQQVIGSNGKAKSYPYVTFALTLDKDMRSLVQKINQANDITKNTRLFHRVKNFHNIFLTIEKLIHTDMCFYKELYAYQTELIERINKTQNALVNRANRLHIGEDRTECIRLHWNLRLASFRFYAMSDLNARVSDEEKNTLKLVLEKKFMQLQKDTDIRITLQLNDITHQLEELFDEGIVISMSEELRLLAIVERVIEEADTFLQQWSRR